MHCRIPSDLFGDYERHVDGISRLLGPAKLPSYCKPPDTGNHAKDSLPSAEQSKSSRPEGGASHVHRIMLQLCRHRMSKYPG